MLERAVENWLTKASERSFQVPFCYMLAREGYTVVHVSRHNAMELGKDIIALDKKGTPCAFQLKGGDISLSKWREIESQMLDLVYGSIVHPAIDTSKPHRAFLVTNGKIEEEAQHAIDGFNKGSKARGAPKLELRVGGQLDKKAKELQSDLWPSELTDARSLLELYMYDGREAFPKAKLAELLEATLPFARTKSGNPPGKKACNRAIASAAVLTALVLSSFTEEKNYVAEVEVWTMYVAYVLALAERWDLQPKYYEAEIEIALRAIKNALTDLAEEAVAREYLAEGFAIVDALFRGVRVTWVAALLCILGLWRKADGDEQTGLDRSIRRFVAENHQDIAPWGESAVPHLLAVYWHDRFVNAMSRRADESLKSLVRFMCEAKKLDGRMVLPDVYVEAKDWLPYVADQQLEKLLPEQFGFRLAKEPLTVNYQGYSHTLEGLVHLLVQQNWKQEVKALWSSVTKINLHTLEFEEPWHFYRWRNEEGTERVVMPQHTRRWEELKTKAGDSSGEGLPNLLRQRPIFALLFVCVYPHRTNAALLQWLNRGLKETIYRA